MVGTIRPLGGKVNVGGGHETPTVSNLNPIKVGSGGPSRGIPNHVPGSMEEMDQIFAPGSVTLMMSSRLRFGDVDWARATSAAAKVMAPGGKVEMNVWCQGLEGLEIKMAFQRAGFKNVWIAGTDVGTMLYANW